MSSPINATTLMSIGMRSQASSNYRKADNNSGDGSWYEALAHAWGTAMDAKANEIKDLSKQLEDTTQAQAQATGATGTQDNTMPSQFIKLTAASQEMGFLSNSAHTSTQSVGSAIETLARKQ
jgi:hypothetical protein